MTEVKTEFDYIITYAAQIGIPAEYVWCRAYEELCAVAKDFTSYEEMTLVYTTHPNQCGQLCDAFLSSHNVALYSVDATHRVRAGQIPKSIDVLICLDETDCEYSSFAKHLINIQSIGKPTTLGRLSASDKDRLASQRLNQWIQLCWNCDDT
jgi:hypothetical protein